jgi:hypothetical protein
MVVSEIYSEGVVMRVSVPVFGADNAIGVLVSWEIWLD